MPYDGAEVSPDVAAKMHVATLRDFLAALLLYEFDMTQWRCGTAACIGGWASTLANEGGEVRSSGEQWNDAVSYLGLTEKQARNLFMPDGWEHDERSPAEAVAVLDHYLATGKIDWSVA